MAAGIDVQIVLIGWIVVVVHRLTMDTVLLVLNKYFQMTNVVKRYILIQKK